MVSADGILTGFVCVGMPRTAAELTLLYERGDELPADRSLLLRFDGPDFDPTAAQRALAPNATVCWCNGVSVEQIDAFDHCRQHDASNASGATPAPAPDAAAAAPASPTCSPAMPWSRCEISQSRAAAR